jgi:hypothetical protein
MTLYLCLDISEPEGLGPLPHSAEQGTLVVKMTMRGCGTIIMRHFAAQLHHNMSQWICPSTSAGNTGNPFGYIKLLKSVRCSSSCTLVQHTGTSPVKQWVQSAAFEYSYEI